uniref:DNA N(6)-methyladenine demethylase n=1 Tax=Davidia involucrata TaxID=16924 RepID=A0A5B7BTE3_DAVIN
MNRGRARNVGRYSSSPTPRGRSSRSGGNSAHRHGPVGVDGSPSIVPCDNKDGSSVFGKQTSGQISVGSMSKQFDRGSTSDYLYQQDFPLPGTEDILPDIGKLKLMQDSQEAVGCSSKQPECISASGSEQDEPSVLAESGIKDRLSKKGSQCEQTSHENTAGNGNSENSECLPVGVPFDICPVRNGTLVTLKAPLLVKNREKRNEVKRSMEGQNIIVLQPGMVLLRQYISCSDQVKMVKKCREVGLGSGGFYQPGYRDGAKLHLKMMCLGKNWDPETSKYGDERSIDGAKPPIIPKEFHQLVEGAIQASHTFLKKQSKVHNVEDILPSMSPNICIVNFYTKNGRLGLHQDKDESPESLRKGLPVVSFSIGDSADFAYSDQRDIDKAEKVKLESGDVLIFGGKSRHIFHGVTAILPDTAPKALLTQTDLHPGRLNLTFREY